MKRRTFLKSVIALCAVPNLPVLQSRPEFKITIPGNPEIEKIATALIYGARKGVEQVWVDYPVQPRGKINPAFKDVKFHWDGISIRV